MSRSQATARARSSSGREREKPGGSYAVIRCHFFSTPRSSEGSSPFPRGSTTAFTNWRVEMLRALVESATTFPELAPVGYNRVSIRWVIDLSRGPAHADLTGPFERGAIEKYVPVRGDRAGTVSETNLKAALLVDNAKYALGLSEDETIHGGRLEHQEFKSVLQKAAQATGDAETLQIHAFLQDHWARQSGDIERKVEREVKWRDRVAFRTGPSEYPFERAPLKKF